MAEQDEDSKTAYAIWLQVEEGELAAGALGVHELVRFLTDPEFALTTAQQATLFRNPRLRADLAALKQRYAVRYLPVAAAASSGDIAERRFPGGLVRLIPSRESTQVYLRISFEAAAVPSGRSSLALERPDSGRIEKLALEAPDGNGVVFQVLDGAVAGDAAILKLLRDPLAEGTFLSS